MSPYSIRIYNKSFGFVDWLGSPISLTVTPRHNLLSTASIVVDADDPKAAGLAAAGARVVIEREGEHLIGGPVRLTRGEGPQSESKLTFSIEDDFRLLHRVLVWPVPNGVVTGNDIAGQTVEYYTVTGPAETVVKDVVSKNAITRLGLPVSTAPNLLRGASFTFTGRFHPLYERLYPALDQAGVGVTVRQSGAGLVVDCYVPKVFPTTLSEASGTLTGWDYSTSAPKATRVVVGGQGEGTARTFKQYVDTSLETVWGDKLEVFQDARDSAAAGIYAERATETLAEGAPMSGFSLSLSETENFRYGGTEGVHVGDMVTVKVGSLIVTDVLREATLTWDAGNGETITPVIGERTDDPNKALAKRLRTLSADNNDRKAR